MNNEPYDIEYIRKFNLYAIKDYERCDNDKNKELSYCYRIYDIHKICLERKLKNPKIQKCVDLRDLILINPQHYTL
jgi:hypothetical protein